MPVSGGEIEFIAALRDKVSEKLDALEKKFRESGKKSEDALGGIQNAVNAINLDRAAESARKFGERASDVTKVRTAFEQLTEAAGISGDRLIGRVKEGTEGLITEFDIMAASNKALLLGLEVNDEAMTEMAVAATALGQAMKQDAGKSLDDLITALGRGSPLILDNLGLTVKVGEANEAYAEQLGKAASKLTEAEKKQAFFNAAMGAAREKTAELGGITVTMNDKLEIQKNRLQDVADGYANALGPLAAVGAEMLQLGSQAALVGGIFPGTTAKIGAMGASIGTKLLPLLLGPVGLIAAIAAAAIGVKAFYDSMARKEVDEFAESIEEMSDEVRDNTRAHLENVIAVSKARLQNKEFSSQYAVIRDQLETAEAKLALLNQTTEEHTEVVEDDVEAVSAAVELTDKQIKALEKEREARLESIDETWRHVEALEEMGRRMEKLSNEGLQAAIDSFETAIPDPEFIRDAIKPFEEMMLGKPGKPPMSEEAEKVKTSMEGAAKSLVTTVAGGTIGGIFNSLASGDWVGAALQGITSVWGFLSGKDKERRRAQEEAQAERIQMWEDERQARIDAAKDVWEEERRLAIEVLEAERDKRLEVLQEQRDAVESQFLEVIAELESQLDGLTEKFDGVVSEMFQWGKITDDFEAFLQGLPDHIDADAIRSKIQSGLDELNVLAGQQQQVGGLKGFIQQFLPKTGIERLIKEGNLSPEAIQEFAAAGGDEKAIIDFGHALQELNRFLKLDPETRDSGVEADLREEVARTAAVLEQDINDILLEIHESIRDVQEALGTDIGDLKTTVTEPLRLAITNSQAQRDFWLKATDAKIALLTTTIGTKLQKLIDKKWDVNVHMTWPTQPGGGGGGGTGTPESPSSNAMGGPVGAGEYSWVGEGGKELVRFGQPGNVIPNNQLQSGPVQLVLRDGTVLAEVVAENMADVASRRGF